MKEGLGFFCHGKELEALELHGKKEIGGEGEEAVEAREEGNGSRGKGRRAGLDYIVQCNGHCFGRPKLF